MQFYEKAVDVRIDGTVTCMRKIGILGGTFNPIHNGHLALGKAAMEQYGLEEVWLMPSKLPPHKSHFAMLSEEHRLTLVSLAATDVRCPVPQRVSLP